MSITMRYAQDIPKPPPAKKPEPGPAGDDGKPGPAGVTYRAPKSFPSGDVSTITGGGPPTVRVKLTQDTVLALSGFKDGQKVSVAFTQDATGGWVVTFPANIRWPGGTVPTVTPTPGKRDVYGFEFWKAAPGDEDPTGSFDGFVIGQNL